MYNCAIFLIKLTKNCTFFIFLCNDRMEFVVLESTFIHIFSINCHGICKTILSNRSNLIIKNIFCTLLRPKLDFFQSPPFVFVEKTKCSFTLMLLKQSVTLGWRWQTSSCALMDSLLHLFNSLCDFTHHLIFGSVAEAKAKTAKKNTY